jgi:hypothetical protein
MGDGLLGCALDVCDMRLRWQSGLDTDAARNEVAALSGSGPAKLIVQIQGSKVNECGDGERRRITSLVLTAGRKLYPSNDVPRYRRRPLASSRT